MTTDGRARTGDRPIRGERTTDPQPTNDDAFDPGPRVLNSADILRGANEVIITHAGDSYRLRHTSNGKLILMK